MEQVRCIHKVRNKVNFFPKNLANDKHWQKRTGWEPQEAPEAPQRLGFIKETQTK